MRYYGALADSEFLAKGKEYYELPDRLQFYISETDIWKQGKTVYPVTKRLGKDGSEYDDGEYIVYVNAEVDDGSRIAKLMKYFKTADPNDNSEGDLSKRVHFLKCEEGGMDIMCEVAERMEKRGSEKACRTLREYAIYTDKVREYAEEMDLADAVERAIRECIAEGVLKDFLEKHRAEAKEMSIFEYEQEKHMRQEREDAWEDARLSMVKKMLENGMSEEDISHIAGVSEEEIERAKNPGLIRTANGMSIFEYDQEKHMRQEREEAWADGHSAGITEGRAENQRLTARNLQQMNMPPEQIARAVGADIDTVRKWLSDS